MLLFCALLSVVWRNNFRLMHLPTFTYNYPSSHRNLTLAWIFKFNDKYEEAESDQRNEWELRMSE